MHAKKYRNVLVGLAVFALFIHLFSSHTGLVEHYYSNGIYPYIAAFLRYLFGWLPFSLGDILYGLAVLWLLYRLIMLVRAIFKKQLFKEGWVISLQRLGIQVLVIYILFNLNWGVNYNRRGIASQLGLQLEKYSAEELKTLNRVLLQKTNESKMAVLQSGVVTAGSANIRENALAAYDAANKSYSFLNYHPASLKSSMWGWLGNYVGFLGYYNPFTGEGQVNTTIPAFLQPYTTCHEIAHQLGYAKEKEANFVGYLAAASSTEASFHYSVYLDLFLYANRNLYETDSTAAREFGHGLLPAVKDDLKAWRIFNERHKNPVEPVVRWMYGKYLENNQQPSGVLSYDEVTGFLIAYYKKYGKL